MLSTSCNYETAREMSDLTNMVKTKIFILTH